jgi:hypothetical protein
MTYPPNTEQWRRGDIVIHHADAKEPYMLMKITGFNRAGLAKCQYVDIRKKRTIYLNGIENLLDPRGFGMNPCWGEVSQHSLMQIQENWERVRRWNRLHTPPLKVRTTSADTPSGGFNGPGEAVAIHKAVLTKGGEAMIYLQPGGSWNLRFVEAMEEVKS